MREPIGPPDHTMPCTNCRQRVPLEGHKLVLHGSPQGGVCRGSGRHFDREVIYVVQNFHSSRQSSRRRSRRRREQPQLAATHPHTRDIKPDRTAIRQATKAAIRGATWSRA